jgi:tetratricopeptide (TPR) repeat protein
MNKGIVTALEPHLQKQVESAHTAFDRGRFERAMALCAEILAAQPDCLPVRKLERAAQLKFAASRRSLVAKLIAAASAAPFLLGGNLKLKDDPQGAMANAEKLLRRDPQNVAALNLLGQAATELGWNETAIFAHEAASELEPGRPDLLVSLGNAYLTGGRAAEAVTAANHVLQLHPENPDARKLLQHASVAVTLNAGKWEQSGGNARTGLPA